MIIKTINVEIKRIILRIIRFYIRDLCTFYYEYYYLHAIYNFFTYRMFMYRKAELF